jgi:hypothetical protein
MENKYFKEIAGELGLGMGQVQATAPVRRAEPSVMPDTARGHRPGQGGRGSHSRQAGVIELDKRAGVQSLWGTGLTGAERKWLPPERGRPEDAMPYRPRSGHRSHDGEREGA